MSAASTQVPEEEMHAKASVFSSSTASSSSSKVKLLRSRTGGVSIGECRKALDASNWVRGVDVYTDVAMFESTDMRLRVFVYMRVQRSVE